MSNVLLAVSILTLCARFIFIADRMMKLENRVRKLEQPTNTQGKE